MLAFKINYKSLLNDDLEYPFADNPITQIKTNKIQYYYA